jgi:hypothetical protein
MSQSRKPCIIDLIVLLSMVENLEIEELHLCAKEQGFFELPPSGRTDRKVRRG